MPSGTMGTRKIIKCIAITMSQFHPQPTYSQPQVIFFDAVGTLFGVKGSVGDIYAELARPYGVHGDAAAIDSAFYQAFKAAPPMAFPGVDVYSIPAREFEWWKAIAQQTFQSVGVLEQFTHFDHFFDNLYEHFATADPWFLYDDTLKTLIHYKNQGVPMGIVSNFDSRIHRVLLALELAGFFDSITVSTDVGVAKPHGQIFEAALEKHRCTPDQAWHIGDSLKEDYEGATSAGLRGILLQRNA